MLSFKEYLALGDNSPTNLGSIQWKIAAAMGIAWAITYAAIVGGVKSGSRTRLKNYDANPLYYGCAAYRSNGFSAGSTQRHKLHVRA